MVCTKRTNKYINKDDDDDDDDVVVVVAVAVAVVVVVVDQQPSPSSTWLLWDPNNQVEDTEDDGKQGAHKNEKCGLGSKKNTNGTTQKKPVSQADQ